MRGLLQYSVAYRLVVVPGLLSWLETPLWPVAYAAAVDQPFPVQCAFCHCLQNHRRPESQFVDKPRLVYVAVL